MRRFHFWSQFVHISPSEGAKNCLREAKEKTVFESYLKIAGSYGVFDSRFGIYIKSYVYRDVFAIIIDFYGELGTKSCFWAKSCFCCSRTACNGSEKIKPAVGLEMFESTSHYLESCFFNPMCFTPFTWTQDCKFVLSTQLLLDECLLTKFFLLQPTHSV